MFLFFAIATISNLERAIIALGKQDTLISGLSPHQDMEIFLYVDLVN
jgi:hypothetical protein